MEKQRYFVPGHNDWRKFFKILDNILNLPFPISISGNSGSGKNFCKELLLKKHKIGKEETIVYEFKKDEKFDFGNVSKFKCIVFNYHDGFLSEKQQDNLCEFISNFTNEKLIIWISKKKLGLLVSEGAITSKLYQLVSIYEVNLPDLSELHDDFERITKYFFDKIRSSLPKKIKVGLSTKNLITLSKIPWTENFSELEFVLKRSIASSGENELVIERPILIDKVKTKAIPVKSGNIINENFESSVNEFKKKLIVETIKKSGGNKTKAAKFLGISKAYIFRMIQSLNIDID